MPLSDEAREPVAQIRYAPEDDAAFARQRDAMVATQIVARGITDAKTLEAMRAVPRHLFVPPHLRHQAYEDYPLPIGHQQTISQPYIVAFMTAVLGLKGGETVLEVGAGSGYQSAVLSRIVARVYGIEIVEPLAKQAAELMQTLDYRNVEIRAGDGYRGWPDRAPFDAIMVTSAAPRVPEALKQQLKDGGRLVLPLGDALQRLRLIVKKGATYEERDLLDVRFVPMTGEIRKD